MRSDVSSAQPTFQLRVLLPARGRGWTDDPDGKITVTVSVHRYDVLFD